MRDALYEKVPYRLNEQEHRYGPQVHLVGNPYLLSLLATLCSKETIQPQVNRLVADDEDTMGLVRQLEQRYDEMGESGMLVEEVEQFLRGQSDS